MHFKPAVYAVQAGEAHGNTSLFTPDPPVPASTARGRQLLMNDDPDRSLAAAPAQQRTKAAAGQSAPKPAGTPHDLTRDLQ
jgi:hypothetical protein